jgi:hypothetical protein
MWFIVPSNEILSPGVIPDRTVAVLKPENTGGFDTRSAERGKRKFESNVFIQTSSCKAINKENKETAFSV